MNNELLTSSIIFAELCGADSIGLSKISFIRKLNKGYWGVFSRKNKLLGKYKTKAEAVERLRQIEYFKHHKSASIVQAASEVTYTELLRKLNENYPDEVVRQFRITFKEAFDEALVEGDKNPEQYAMKAGLAFIDGLDSNLEKVASAIEMGDPVYAGKYIAEIIKFLMRRIKLERRAKSLNGLKNKIYMLNEYDISRKKMPASASLGQAISLTKNLLMMHSPGYIRTVLNSIVSNL